MSDEKNEWLSDKLGDLGNLAAAALVLGQFISDKPFDWSVFIAGGLFTLACYVSGYLLRRGR